MIFLNLSRLKKGGKNTDLYITEGEIRAYSKDPDFQAFQPA